MTAGFNLPPGCNVSDIPGNSAEDEQWEKLIERIYDTASRWGIDAYSMSKAIDLSLSSIRQKQADSSNATIPTPFDPPVNAKGLDPVLLLVTTLHSITDWAEGLYHGQPPSERMRNTEIAQARATLRLVKEITEKGTKGT